MSTGNSRAAVKYEFIRNATARLHYAGRVFLLDPMLSIKGAFRPFAGIAPNPVVDLPTAVDDVVEGIDAVVVSHLHPDHVDDAAVRILSTDLPVYTPLTAHTRPSGNRSRLLSRVMASPMFG